MKPPPRNAWVPTAGVYDSPDTREIGCIFFFFSVAPYQLQVEFFRPINRVEKPQLPIIRTFKGVITLLSTSRGPPSSHYVAKKNGTDFLKGSNSSETCFKPPKNSDLGAKNSANVYPVFWEIYIIR